MGLDGVGLVLSTDGGARTTTFSSRSILIYDTYDTYGLDSGGDCLGGLHWAGCHASGERRVASPCPRAPSPAELRRLVKSMTVRSLRPFAPWPLGASSPFSEGKKHEGTRNEGRRWSTGILAGMLARILAGIFTGMLPGILL